MAECSRCPSGRSNSIRSRLSPRLGSCISIGGESHAFTISLADRWHCCCSTHCLSDLVLLPTPNSQRCTDAKIAAGKEAEVAGSNTKVIAKSTKQSYAAFRAPLKISFSLNRYTFCQISWLVNIETFHCGDMVGEELERQNRQEWR